jgi:hypothetical protein
MSEEVDPWDRQAWQPLLDFVAEMEALWAAEATASVDADADLDGWLAAVFEALRPAEAVLGPPWCVDGPGAGRPSRRPAALGRALPPRPGASRCRYGGR